MMHHNHRFPFLCSPQCTPTTFLSLRSTPLLFSFRKENVSTRSQLNMIKQNTTRQGKTHSTEDGQGKPAEKQCPKIRKKRRDTPTIRCPTKHQTNSCNMHAAALVQTLALLLFRSQRADVCPAQLIEWLPSLVFYCYEETL